MKSTKNNIESEVILEFEKIKPAITRLLQSESNNKNLILRLGKSSSENSNEVTINPTILVNSIENSNINKKDVLIGTVVHESIHSINEYEINHEIDFKNFNEEIEGLKDIEDILEVLSGPFGQYVFEIIIHSLEEKNFVKKFNGLFSILKEIYFEKESKILSLKEFNIFLTLLFHRITNYIEIDMSKYKSNIKKAIDESLPIVNNLNSEDIFINDVIESTIEVIDICKRHNLLPDLDKYSLGEKREIVESMEDTIINDLNKTLIPSSVNITTGNALEKFIGDKDGKKDNNKENLMDDHITKVGASETIYLPDGKVSKLVSTKLPNNFDSLYSSGSLTYNNLLEEWNLPVFKVTNKIKPYFIHNQKRQRISGYDQGDLSPHVPLMLASGRYERMFEQKQRLSNKSYAVSLLIDGSGSMLEKKKGEFYPWSLSAGLIGASYLAQICHELNIDFELAIFNRGFVSDENETETNYLSRKMSVSSMLNTNYGSNAENYFNTTNHYFVKDFKDNWKDNYEKFIGLVDFSRKLRDSIDNIDIKNDIPPISMFERSTNVDERNIMYATKRLLTHPSNSKMLVVLSDGMTRGSLSDLKNSIHYATKNNIDVVGIGIGERGTWKEYINHTQIFKPEELIYSIVNITKDILIKNMKENIGAA